MRKPAVNIAVQAARKAAVQIHRAMKRLDAISVVEKDRYDFSSEIDRLAEQEIVRELTRAYPDHAILAEESGAKGDSRFVWIIDPIDGTSNFLRGFPHFCISIALAENGVVQHGVVYDPLRDELFTASRGGGAFLNDRRIRVAGRASIAGSLIATGFPYRERRSLPLQLRMVEGILKDAEDLRRTGSAALDLSYVAAGRLDGFFETGLKPWDMAAGTLLVQEAGGVVLDLRGGNTYLSEGDVIAANMKVAAGMVARIKPMLASKVVKADAPAPAAD